MTEGTAGSNRRTKEPTRKDEVMGWLLLSMLYSPQLREKRDAAFTQIGGVSPGATEKLEALGCERRRLITAAILGTSAREFYPPISAQRLKNMAAKLRSDVSELKEIVPQIYVPEGQILEDGQLEIVMGPAGGDMQLEPWVEKSLLNKAALFDELAAMCTAKDFPDRAEFSSTGRVWPLVYVEAKTGDPHYALVARLLEEIDANATVDMTRRRLRDAYVSVKERHPAVLRWIRHATTRLETLEAEGNLVLFARLYDQNETIEHIND